MIDPSSGPLLAQVPHGACRWLGGLARRISAIGLELACHVLLTGSLQVSRHPPLSATDRRAPILPTLPGMHQARLWFGLGCGPDFSLDREHIFCSEDFQDPGQRALRAQQHQAAAALP